MVRETLTLPLMQQFIQPLLAHGLLDFLLLGVVILVDEVISRFGLLKVGVLGGELFEWGEFGGLIFEGGGVFLYWFEIQVIYFEVPDTCEDSVGSEYLLKVKDFLIVLPVTFYLLIGEQVLPNIYFTFVG